jgi:hypothetical protein
MCTPLHLTQFYWSESATPPDKHGTTPTLQETTYSSAAGGQIVPHTSTKLIALNAKHNSPLPGGGGAKH